MSVKISKEAAEKRIPMNAKGKVTYEYDMTTKIMSFKQFLDLREKFKKDLKTCTYWIGYRDGKETNNALYTELFLDMKFNGKYVFSFHILEKSHVDKNGELMDKVSFVTPTKSNSRFV